MSCSNCYNGCPQIVSDQCVKYTGIDIPILGIQNGDSLSYVEQALITFLVSTLDGTGIKPNISLTDTYLCNLVKQYLPDCEDITAANLFIALIKAACDLQAQVTALTASTQSQIDDINDVLDTLNATYTGVGVGTCLPSVSGNAGTHAIVQAVIDQLCNVTNTYVQLADLNTLIQNYLDSIAPSNKFYNKMVPWTVVEYYQDLDYYLPASGFSPTGAGFGQFEKIYICNGNNGTPDKRGRVSVGAIQNVGGGPLDPEVDPGSLGGFNPNYDKGTKAGNNNVTLTSGQIPAHTHIATATSTVTPNPHNHGYTGVVGVGWPDGASGNITAGDVYSYPRQSQLNDVTLSVDVAVTVLPNAGGGAHANNQPAIGAYYIMYIP